MMDWKKFPFEKQELLYVAVSSVFAIAWFVGLLPFVISILGTSYAVVQFLLFNIGLYLFLFIFLKTLIADLKLHLKATLGFVFLVIGLDIWMPAYHVTIEGKLLTGANLGVSSSDYIIGLLGSTIGIGGLPLYLWTYLLFPVLFLLISAKLLPNFLKKL